MPPDHSPQSRKGKERESQTDLAERIFATQRSKNASTRRERPATSPRPAEKSPMAIPISPRSNKSPHVVVSRPTANPEEADHEDFSRRLKISNSTPRHHPSSSKSPNINNSKLFNPETDPIPLRTAEPESMSESDSYAPRGGNAQRQLFNHRKDDPVRFSVLARPSAGRPTPTPKSSGEYISASSTSSYAHSSLSSSFTLSSNTTDDSSANSALFERERKETGNNAFAVELKRLYRGITCLEGKISQQDSELECTEEAGRVVLKGRPGKEIRDEDAEQQKWKKVIADHKMLAEMMHNLLEISLNPSVPASLRNIPTKYNIIIRLWTHAFHKLLETLRRASFDSPLALEHLQEFIYYAYTFYTGLLEEPSLKSFRNGWLEALGDLARYRMAVAAMVNGPKTGGEALTAAALSTFPSISPTPSSQAPTRTKSSSTHSAGIGESPTPSVGLAAAKLLDVEPEKERWRGIAKDWYGAGLADTPGTGKLHHHLGLLCREADGEELRAIYHFIKSMTTLHPFPTSRESVLPLWSALAQSRRSLPDTRVSDLFVLLHGMLFTNIQLDDFAPTLARFIERLEIEGAQETEWIMMGIVNIGAVLEYGKAGGVVRKAGGLGGTAGGGGGVRVITKRVEEEIQKMDVDDEPHMGGGEDESMRLPPSSSPAMSIASSAAGSSPAEDYPPPFKFALQLTFSMLTYVLRHPTRKANAFARTTLNPYLTILLTFLATVCKQEKVLGVLERSIPWEELAGFLACVPRAVMLSQGLNVNSGQKSGDGHGERWMMLTSGCAPPLEEDWCLRGMEWVGRKVFERGFWKSGEDKKAEIEVLDKVEGEPVTDGIIEDEDTDDDDTRRKNGAGETVRRWTRIVRCAVGIAGVVDGFRWVEGTRSWSIEGELERKVELWKEEARKEREEEERRRRVGTRWDDVDSMDIDGGDVAEDDSEESGDDEMDSDEVKALKSRRRYLRSLLQSASRPALVSSPTRRPRPRGPHRVATSRPALRIVPGYSVLVIDTNILLSSLPMFSSLVESFCWTVLVPVPVVMELDGLASNTSQLGEAASAAMAYISSHIRSHSTSLKVQTSKGNYLTTLSVHSEQLEFGVGEGERERNMDDLILKAAIWQDEHWVDRTALLKGNAGERGLMTGAVKVVLLSLDRNLRLKARSRQLPAASEKDLATVLATRT